MDKNEWITIDMFSREYECSHAELCIEVRVYQYCDVLQVEPVYFKLVGKGGKIHMDGSYQERERNQAMWSFITHVVAAEYTDSHLDWMIQEHPGFEELRRIRNDQNRLDREWYRAQVI